MSKAEKNKIAKLIKDARVSKGYSQQQLADLTQLNLRSVQRIEKAEVLPRAYSLNLLAKQLNLDIEAFALTEKSVQTTAPVNPELINHPSHKARKLILSITLVLLSFLLTAAFLSQASGFPETSFELFLLLALIVALNGFLLWRIYVK